MPNLTFSDEGPQYYGLAYARNKQWAKPGPYFTVLNPQEEQKFRQWLQTTGNPSNFDPNAKVTDYDMRGYWKDYASKGKNLSGINKSDMRLHFPDIYKTPYDTTFSGESRYAKPGTPTKWVDSGIPGKERLINTKTGEVLYQKKQLPTPGYPTQLINQLGTTPQGMGPTDLAKRNTRLLTQWSGVPRSARKLDPNSFQGRQLDPEFADLLSSNPSYVERTTPDYINQMAQTYAPLFQGLPFTDRATTAGVLKDQLRQMYPNAEDDQDEVTPQGQAYWDALRGIMRAYNTAK